jgi:alkanesulfonate monooxygenase SsuD/methylene tetrahydromethanopterin reductase-like flavin-dependent oxidoreductase (luciferase family)
MAADHPVRIAEVYAMLQYLADGRVDLMIGRVSTAPDCP